MAEVREEEGHSTNGRTDGELRELKVVCGSKERRVDSALFSDRVVGSVRVQYSGGRHDHPSVRPSPFRLLKKGVVLCSAMQCYAMLPHQADNVSEK